MLPTSPSVRSGTMAVFLVVVFGYVCAHVAGLAGVYTAAAQVLQALLFVPLLVLYVGVIIQAIEKALQEIDAGGAVVSLFLYLSGIVVSAVLSYLYLTLQP